MDQPNIGREDYYDTDEKALFTKTDHARLAVLLNATPALVALSYYEHPFVDDLYPATRWRRLTWTQAKAVQKTRDSRKSGREVLLMN